MARILAATIGCLLAGGALAQDAAPEWSYEGKDGPEHWAELYEACSGKHQSPIDVVPTKDVDLPAIAFAYAPGDATVVHKGHVVQADVPAGSSITIDDHTYMLKQFHFHAPGENRIGGVSYPLEAHLVHADAEGKLAVVAVPYSIGLSNPGLAAIWPKLPHKAGDSAPLPALSPETLLPASRDYYHYEGSLTTPPCTEGVQWLVMKHPQTATTGQISRFVTLLPHANSRPPQAANGRKIEE